MIESMEESESESQNPRLRALSAWWRKIVGRQSRADLIAQIIEMRAQGRLTEDAGRMIEGVLHIADMKVRDVMIPNPEVVSIPLAASRDEAGGDGHKARTFSLSGLRPRS